MKLLLLFVLALCPVLAFGQHFSQKAIPIIDGGADYRDTIKLDKPGNKIAVYGETRVSLAKFFNVPKAAIVVSPRNNGSLSADANYDFTGYDDEFNKSFNCHAAFTVNLAVMGSLYVVEIYNFKIQSYIDYSPYKKPDWYDFDFDKYYSKIDSFSWANKTMKNFDQKNREIITNIESNVMHK